MRRIAWSLGAVTMALGSTLSASALGDGRCGPDVCRADIAVFGYAAPQPIRVGRTSSLKLTAKNNGADGALAVDLQVTVAEGLRIVSVRRYGGRHCRHRYQFVKCDLGDFAREQEAVVVIKVRGQKTGTFVNHADVYASDIVDANLGNNVAGVTVAVKRR